MKILVEIPDEKCCWRKHRTPRGCVFYEYNDGVSFCVAFNKGLEHAGDVHLPMPCDECIKARVEASNG